jgi:hypothetical protein
LFYVSFSQIILKNKVFPKINDIELFGVQILAALFCGDKYARL